MAKVIEIITAVIIAGALLFYGVGLFSDMASQAGASEIQGHQTNVPVALEGTSYTTLGDVEGTNETVENTTGYQLALHGDADTAIGWQSGLDTDSDDTYTVCTFAALDDSPAARTANRTLMSAGGDVTLSYRNATGGDDWHVFLYDPESRTSTQFTAPATAETNRGQLCVVRDNSDVRLYRNATLIGSTTFSESGIANANLSTQAWNGTLEETRFFADPLNSAERNQTYNQPTAPLTGANRTDRIYFDAGEGGNVYVFLAPNEPQAASIEGGYSWTASGFDGAEMAAGTDYQWDTDGPRVRALAGGDLETQPGAWVSYTAAEGFVDEFSRQLAQSITAFVVIFPVLAIVLVLLVLRTISA